MRRGPLVWATIHTADGSKGSLAISGLLAFGAGLGPAAFALGVSWLVGAVQDGTSRTAAIALMALAMASQQVLPHVSNLLASLAGRQAAYRAKKLVYETSLAIDDLRLLDAPKFHDQLRIARVAATDGMGRWAPALVGGCRVVVAVIAILGLIASTSALATLPAILMVLTGVRTERRSSLLQVEHIAAAAEVDREYLMYEVMGGQRDSVLETRALGVSHFFVDKYETALQASLKLAEGRDRRVALLAVSQMMLSTVAVLTALAIAAAADGMTAPKMAAIIAAFVSLQAGIGGLVSQAGQIVRSGDLLASLHAFIQRFGNTTTGPDEPGNGEQSTCTEMTTVRFDNVWFRYNDESQWVLQGVSFTLSQGELVGLVGPNGAGKSTIAKLAAGLYVPSRGNVFWGSIDVTDIPETDRVKLLAYMAQTFGRFELTLFENIGLGRSVSRTAAQNALALIEAELPCGLDSRLGTRFLARGNSTSATAELSGGQWQRVGLARALAEPGASLVIFDEPSSALDALSERRVAAAIEEFAANKIGLVVTHRLGVLSQGGRILVVDKGQVVGVGTHQSLLRECQLYNDMYSSETRAELPAALQQTAMREDEHRQRRRPPG